MLTSLTRDNPKPVDEQFHRMLYGTSDRLVMQTLTDSITYYEY